MGSRLKSKQQKKVNKIEEWRVLKLVVYFLLTAGALAIFAYNFYGNLEPAIKKPPDAGQEQ
jgi:hypothetical protein